MAQSCIFSRLSVEKEAASPCLETNEVHVLAVDDNLLERKMIEKLLKTTSCKVTAVDSGSRALQFLGLDKDEIAPVGFDGLKVDLIITDYCMPGMTGYELLKKIKGSSSFREIPVVIMSSENILARIDRCLEEGAEDFIVKPVKLSDVERLKSCMFGDGRIQRKDGFLSSPPHLSHNLEPLSPPPLLTSSAPELPFVSYHNMLSQLSLPSSPSPNDILSLPLSYEDMSISPLPLCNMSPILPPSPPFFSSLPSPNTPSKDTLLSISPPSPFSPSLPSSNDTSSSPSVAPTYSPPGQSPPSHDDIMESSPPFPNLISSLSKPISISPSPLLLPNYVVPSPSPPAASTNTTHHLSSPLLDDTPSDVLPLSISLPSSPKQSLCFASRQHMPCSPTSQHSPTRRIELISHD